MEAKKAIRKEIFRRRKETDPASICKNSAKIWQKLFSGKRLDLSVHRL